MLSRKVVYFLFGFAISCVVFLSGQYVYADCETQVSDYLSAAEAAASSHSATLQSGYVLGSSASVSYFDSTCFWYGGNVALSDGWYIAYSTTSKRASCGGGTGDAIAIMWYSGSCTVVDTPVDSDGDGLVDSADFYPDDPNPYLQKLVVAYEDENGNEIGWVYQTDRGDYFTVGTIPEDGSGAVIKIGTAYETPTGSALSDDDFPETTKSDLEDQGVVSVPSTTTDVTPDSDVGTGTGSESGDTDNTLQGKIADNTAKAVDGLAKISAYNKSLFEAVQKSNVLTAIGNSTAEEGLTYQQGRDDDLDSEGDTAVSDGLEGVDVTDSYNDTTLPSTLVEGTDYDAAEGLGEQSWWSDFVSANPYKTALDNSGFNLTSASCTMEFSLPAPISRTFTLSICDFSDSFVLAGNILLSITTLGGFMLLVRG